MIRSKNISILIILLLIGFNVRAQKNKEKIKSLKVAHITEELNLTPSEAENFWPLYNAFEVTKEALRKSEGKAKRKTNYDNLSEKEATAFIENLIKIEHERAEAHKVFLKKLLQVIPAKKVAKLIQSERTFKLKMIKEFKGRLENRRARN